MKKSQIKYRVPYYENCKIIIDCMKQYYKKFSSKLTLAASGLGIVYSPPITRSTVIDCYNELAKDKVLYKDDGEFIRTKPGEFYFLNQEGKTYPADEDFSKKWELSQYNKLKHFTVYGSLRPFNGNKRNELVVHMVLSPQDAFKDNNRGIRYIPTGIPGLDTLLFPESASRIPSVGTNGTGGKTSGFPNPKLSKTTTPKVVLIKGAPGTGKTTLAVQMLANMVETGINCAFLSSKNGLTEVCDISKSFGFNDNLGSYIGPQKRVFFRKVGLEPIKSDLLYKQGAAFPYICSNSYIPKDTTALFIDSLNVADGEINRNDIWTLFEKYRVNKLLTFIFLEDYGDNCIDAAKQLLADCEFFADIVIQLEERFRYNYHSWSIKIKKKHYGPQIYGEHSYKIYTANHPLSHILKDTKGIYIYPSIHRYLSGSRIPCEPFMEKDFVQTGISHLDYILLHDKKNTKDLKRGKAIAPDSCVLISGEKGGHKLALGLNILMGGLWLVNNKPKMPYKANKDVLLILLDEEANIEIPRIAMARETHRYIRRESLSRTCLDNRNALRGFNLNCFCYRQRRLSGKHKAPCKCNCYCSNKTCNWKSETDIHGSHGKKVFFRRWCTKINKTNDCRKLVVAGFRPGYISTEEFMHIVNKMISSNDFSRVMFYSTAHLETRFPLLFADKLFIPALIDVFKKNRVISIIVDVIGDGSDKKLSHGLAALADYQINTKQFQEKDRKKITAFVPGNEKKRINTRIISQRNYSWSNMSVNNVRGKEYAAPLHALTVMPGNGKENSLYIIDINDERIFRPLIQ